MGNNAPLAEVTGKRGEPQPQQWTFLFLDQAARGGVREVVVDGNAIVSQRTPLRGYAGLTAQGPLPTDRFKVDSTKAFEVANAEAMKNRLAFHWVDYSLDRDASTGAPAWTLKLYNNMGAPVGTVVVSAENGFLIKPLQTASSVPLEQKENDLMNSPTGKRIGGLIGTVGNAVERTAKNVSNASLRAVGTVQEVLTGERTIGPKEDEE